MESTREQQPTTRWTELLRERWRGVKGCPWVWVSPPCRSTTKLPCAYTHARICTRPGIVSNLRHLFELSMLPICIQLRTKLRIVAHIEFLMARILLRMFFGVGVR